MKAAIYTRISDDQTGEGLGVRRQEEDCRALVDGLGWQIVDLYQDNDISATSGKRRPNYERMLADVREGRIDAIVAWNTDRLYRKMTDLEPLIETLEKHGTVVRTVKAGEFDLATAMGRMIARILASVSQGEGEVKSERWKRSVRQRREQGRVPGAPLRLYGMTRDGELIPEEAAVVKAMAAQLIAGQTLVSITRALNEQGLVNSIGNPWRTTTVRQLLKNPRIAGHSVLRGEILGRGQWDAVLDEETWEHVKAILDARSKTKGPRVALLLGILRCGVCETPMVTASRIDPTAGRRRLYRCPNRPGWDGCGKIAGDAEPIEEVVESFARARIEEDPGVVQRAAELIGTGNREVLAEVTSLEARLLELDAQLAEPGTAVSAIMRAMDRVKERIAECRAILAASRPVQPTRGGEWPADLQRRRRLVDIALEGRPVYLDRSKPSRGFDPTRVRIGNR